MTTAINLLSVTANGGTLTRDLGERFSEIVNVRDFGAFGLGTVDERAQIQAAIDYAYGPWTDAHAGSDEGGSEQYTNKALYFPAGYYLVRSLIESRAISGYANNGSGLVRLTVSTTGLASGDTINLAGVVRDTTGISDPHIINHTWFIDVIDGTHCDLRYSEYANTGTYVSGGTITTPGLRFREVSGGHIFGAGRKCTRIESMSANASTVATAAMSWTKIEQLSFQATDNGTAFQLDKSGQDPSLTCNLQSNTFQNCMFGGVGGHPNAYGLAVGRGQSMGSENMILNCYIGGSVAGVSFWNYNACDNTIMGGNIAGSGYGIYVYAGSINTIHGISFQTNTIADIYIERGASDSYSIVGCRSESPNFLRIGASQPFNISGCNQRSGPGFFVKGAGYVTINSCNSLDGYVESENGHYSIINCHFERADYLTAGPATNFASLHITPMPVKTVTASTYQIASSDMSQKIRFDLASAQTVTVPRNDDGTIRTVAGCWIEVQRVGSGEVTFVGGAGGVVIRSGSGLRLNAQYSAARLTCDSTNLWTLSGDTKV